MISSDVDASSHLRSNLNHLAPLVPLRENRDRHPLRLAFSRDERPGLEILWLNRLTLNSCSIAAGELPELIEANQPRPSAIPNQQRFVAGEAGAAVADARAQELRADAGVEAHPPRDLLHVSAD